MRIVQVIDHLNVGGAERVLVDLSNLLYEKGQDVTVLCLLAEGKLDKKLHKSIPVIYLRRKNKYNPVYLYKLYKIVSQFDIIHIHLRQVLRYVSLFFYSFKLHKKTTVLFHDHYGKINTDKAISNSLKFALKHCKAYIGVSNQLTLWAENNAVNSKIFKLGNIVRSATRSLESKRPTDQIHVVSVGNFRPQKNYEFLCALIAECPKKFNFTIYGHIVDANYYTKICNLIEKLNIAHSVKIISDCDSVTNELQHYHIGLHCASSETGPLVALEYMNAALPFLAYSTGDVAEDVSKNYPNFIQKNFKIEHWITNMEHIVSNREDYSSSIKSYVTDKYSEDTYLSKCLAIYNQLQN